MATPTEEDTRPKVLICGEWRKVPDGYPSAKPKSSNTKTDLICKRAYATPCSGCMFCGLYFPLPVWCTNGGAYKIAIILAP